MEENKNTEMSVDELLKKLQESLQADEPTKSASQEPTDTIEEITTEDKVPWEELEDSEKSEESAEPEDLEEAEKTEDSDAVAEAESADLTEEEDEPSGIGEINEDDIFAAWGIDRSALQKEESAVVTAETGEPETAPEIAVPVSSAKVYYIARIEKKEDFALRKHAEVQKDAVDYDRTDYSLIKQALGMEKPDADVDSGEFPIFEEVPQTSATPESIDAPHSEFTYQRQRDDIVADYKRTRRMSSVKLIFTLLLTVALFLVECLPAFGVAMPDVLNVSYYPVVFSMVTMQLMWLVCAFSYKEIANGALGLLKYKLRAGGVLAILALLTTVCNVVNCVFGMSAPIYNFSVAFCALILRMFEHLDICREIYAFDVASSTQSQKYVAVTVPAEKAGQIAGLEDYMGEDALILRTEKCSFVENYFARTEKREESDIQINKFLVPVVLAVAAAAAIISAAQGGTVASSFGVFNAGIAVGLPVLVMLTSSYPLYKAGKRLYRRESAIIGESAVEDYSGTTMICFDDADAFPSYGVALENLRIYGKGDIETIIEQMGAIFSKLGGPLKHVFSLMITDCPKPYKVKIEGVYEDGICATVDGKTLFVGNAAYMEENGFTVVDKSDEIGGKHFSTMYLAQEGALCAKFFIRYTLDGSFESIVKKLARRGIASVILTGDSNINDELLARSLDMKKLPIKVARRKEFEGALQTNRSDSGVVSRGGVGDLVSSVTMCDRLAGVIGTMRAVRIASAVICAFLMIGACLLHMQGSVSSWYVLLYHLFWLIPAWLVAKFNL